MTEETPPEYPTDRRALTAGERFEVWLAFGGVGLVLLGLALPLARVMFTDGSWLALTPCTLVTGLPSHLSGGAPGVCSAPFGDLPLLGWVGNLHNRNLVAWGFGIFMAGILSSGGLASPEEEAA